MNLSSTLAESFSNFKLLVDFAIFATHVVYSYLEVFYRFLFPPPIKTLEGEIILITGAGGEIGRQICLQLAQTGSKIICVDHNSFDNDIVFKELRDGGAKVFRYDVDISQRTHVEDLAIKIRREVGDVTIVINAAEMMPIDDFVSQSPDLLERTFELNVLSQFWILKQFLPKMIEIRKGHIVTICSMAGLLGSNQAVGYSSSKFAVNGYLEALKDEISNHPLKPDIKFTTAYPFLFKTNLSKGISFKPRFSSFSPILEPAFIAQEVISGMRRNYEYIYCPSSLYVYEILAAIMPRKLQRAGKQFLQLDIQRTQKQIANGKFSPVPVELLKED